MKKALCIIAVLSLCLCLWGCNQASNAPILATTKPVYCFASALCADTGLDVDLLVTENVSCLHDYSVQVSQMQKIEKAETIVINGAGFESFLDDILPDDKHILDASTGISPLCADHHHEGEHSHETDPHIWLSIPNARVMAENIAVGLSERYPDHSDQISKNLSALQIQFDKLEQHSQELDSIAHRQLITFHDGFSYLADAFDLEILRAIEEESGAEASPQELITIIESVNAYELPAIFTEVSGATAAAEIIQRETKVKLFSLDMGLSDRDYFDAMHYNITTLKEALE